MIRFYAPVHAESVNPYAGTRMLTEPAWGYEGEREPRLYEAGTVYTPEEGGCTDEGLSYVDVVLA